MGNSIELKSVEDLLGMSFFIPNYQRGYRWEQTQVKDLLEDILAFSKTRKEDEIYCIQPLVVSQKDEEDILEKCREASSLEEIKRYLRGTWNVVDGQQRLTTIYLILCYLKIQDKYVIDYSTRKGSREFLLIFGEINTKSESIQDKSEENIDYFFMHNAYKAIEAWFENHNDDEKDKFQKTLLKNVKFIWYQVASNQEISVFKRLNIGKIPLTDSELIKALFLNRGNFSFEGKDVEYIQERIASEWDQIEYRLQDDEFWSFINNNDYEKPTRIDLILDLICEHDDLKIEQSNLIDLGNDSHKTFRYFFNKFNQINQNLESPKNNLKSRFVNDIWKKIKYYFQVFDEWYHDYRLFHYVGYLTSISKPCNASDLMELYQSSCNKEEFVERIKGKIVEKLRYYSWLKNLKSKDEFTDYVFDQDENAIKRDCVCILLLHNIETIIQQNKKLVSESKYNLPNFTKFPFHLYKKEKWQVEHIRPYSGDDLQDKDKQKIYLSLAKEYLTNEDGLIKKIDNFLSDKGNYDFSSILEELNKTGGDNQLSDDDKNQLWNFVLLDEATNKEYGNQIFPVKRAFIINKEKGYKVKYEWKNGNIDGRNKIEEIAFVPPCTKNVFAKTYTNMPSSMVNWTVKDAKGYLNDILETLDYYIKNLIDNGTL